MAIDTRMLMRGYMPYIDKHTDEVLHALSVISVPGAHEKEDYHRALHVLTQLDGIVHLALHAVAWQHECDGATQEFRAL